MKSFHVYRCCETANDSCSSNNQWPRRCETFFVAPIMEEQLKNIETKIEYSVASVLSAFLKLVFHFSFDYFPVIWDIFELSLWYFVSSFVSIHRYVHHSHKGLRVRMYNNKHSKNSIDPFTVLIVAKFVIVKHSERRTAKARVCASNFVRTYDTRARHSCEQQRNK